MIDFTRLETRVMNDEGFSASPYKDTVGVPTIGYGATDILGRPVSMDTPKITPQVARTLLRAHLYGAVVDAQHLFPRFREMDPVRQEALTNMAYNLGRNRLGKFKRMIAAADDLNYSEMATEAQMSKWFGQVGDRGLRIVKALREGTW